MVCSNDAVAVTYGLFPDPPSMQTDYQADVAAARPTPHADSHCSTGAFESGYELAGVHTGRLLCTTYQANGVTYRVMEWTNESLAMIAWADTADLDWPAFIAFANGAREHR